MNPGEDVAVVEDLAFEDALSELEAVVSRLEGEGLTLDEAVALYERGRALAQRCQHLLDTAELRVQQVGHDTEGGSTVVPLDVPEIGA